MNIHDQRLTLANVYGYYTDEPSFYHEILQKIASYNNSTIITCGDWNVVQDMNKDTYNVKHNRNPNSKKKDR